MIENNYLINQTELYFLEKRTEKTRIESLNEEALMADENFSTVKYQLKACTFDLQKAKYLNDNEQIAILANKQAELKAKLDEIKAKLNVTLSTYSPACKSCEDEGTVSGAYCKCFYEKLNELAYEFLEMPIPKLFSFEQDSKATENAPSIEKLKRYAEKFYSNSPSNLVFAGQRGTGKTFTASAIADYLNKKSYNTLFLNAYQLNNVYLKMAYASQKDKIIYEEILTTCDLLVIDDLGAEKILKGITAESLLMIITQRLANNKPFIVTTNLTANEIAARYGERVLSRMCGNTSAIVKFKGKDQRFQNS